ncbi:MAG TPA: hypothetical protein VK211_13330 [Kamptonema sp.]|nr:hypothetical protein [Kamptonema sp.]
MGLTIHYSLKLDSLSIELAKEKLTALHEVAVDLPFAQVGEIVEFEGEDCHFDRDNRDDRLNFLKLHAYKYVRDGDSYSSVAASRAIAFCTWPGQGCEAATFGLALHPKQTATDLTGWSWSSFCKTQYASNPEYGGIEHFLKCHLLVIKMLDSAQELGILNRVSDEGKYWENRNNIQELAECVGNYNALVAAVVGRISNLFGEGSKERTYSPISDYPNFEYLEAEGSQKIDEGNLPN